MVNGAFNFSAGPRDLRLQRGNALAQFLDRQRVEILSGQLREQIAGAPGKVFGVHGRNR